MQCPSCSTVNPSGKLYCAQCGAKLAPDSQSEDSSIVHERSAREALDRAQIARAEGDVALALALALEAEERAPDLGAVHLLLASVYEQMGDQERANRHFSRLVALRVPGIDPDRLRILASARRAGRDMLPQMTGMFVAGAAVMALAAWIAWPNTPEAQAAALSPTSPSQRQAAAVSPLPPETGQEPLHPTWQTAAPRQPERVAAAADEPSAGAPASGPRIAPRAPTTTVRPVSMIVTRPQPVAGFRPSPAGEMLLPPEGGNPGDVTIHITSKGGSGGSATPQSTGQAEPTGTGSVQVSHAASAAPPSGRSSDTQEALASQLYVAGQYSRALDAYTRALPGAGDDAAWIYERIGECYRRTGDKASALRSYQRALAAYKDQVTQGRNAAAASAGVRVCQRAIQLCQD